MCDRLFRNTQRMFLASLGLVFLVSAGCGPEDWDDSSAKNDDGEDAVELAEAYELSDEELHPESGDYDPVTQGFFVGSIGHGNITRIEADGEESIFYEGTGEEDRMTLGIRADVERRRLWVCSIRMIEPGVEPGLVWLFDIDDGTLLDEFVLEETYDGASCNDVDVDSRGWAYVTDRQNPNIYRIDPDESSVEIWAQHEKLEPDVIGLNGIVVTPDEQAVIVTKFFLPQLLRISFSDPEQVSEVTLEGDSFTGRGGSFSGADGLVMRGDEVYVVFSDSVMRLDFDEAWTAATVSAKPLGTGFAAGILAEDSIYAVKGMVVEYALEMDIELPFELIRIDLGRL